MVMMGPVLGFFYVLILPFIGMAMILTVVARQIGHMLSDAFGATAAFGWRPVEAYLMSHRKPASATSSPTRKRPRWSAREGVMYTLFDFITQVKGAEYLIAVSAVGLFILFWEVLKPKPFRSMIDTAKAISSRSAGVAALHRC